MNSVDIFCNRVAVAWEGASLPFIHAFRGAKALRIPWPVFAMSLTLMIVLNLGLDEWLLLGLPKMVRTKGITEYLSHGCFVILAAAPFFVWGAWAAFRFVQIKRIITRDFVDLGLTTVRNRVPHLLGLYPVDDTTLALKLQMNGVPIESFKDKRHDLASKFGVYITKLEERRTQGILSIFFTPDEIPRYVKLTNPGELTDFKIRIGYGAGRKELITDLEETPHLLIGGSTKMGKSTFFRQAITTLWSGNRGKIKIAFIDLKMGMESSLFRSLEDITTISTTEAAGNYLHETVGELTARGKVFAEVGVQNYAGYHRELAKRAKEEDETKLPQLKPYPRIVIFIDEAAELFTSGEKRSSAKVSEAKKLCARIAAQGRAVGIHLVIGTQRPDASTVDTHIKGNLSGRVGFYATDNASSMVILDSVRAADLSRDDKGRAIWRNGPDLVEVQTPDYPPEDAEAYLDTLRLSPDYEEEKKAEVQEEKEVKKAVLLQDSEKEKALGNLT